MAIDNQHFFTRCPHCRTMFRVGSVVTEKDEAWVKCGRCKKVFDYKKNKIDLSAFLKSTEGADVTSAETESANQTETTKLSTLSVNEKTDSSDHETTKPSALPIQEKTDAGDSSVFLKPTENSATTSSETVSEDQTEKIESSAVLVKKESINTEGDNQPEEQLSFIKTRGGERVENTGPHKPLFQPKDNVDEKPSSRQIKLEVEKNETTNSKSEVKKPQQRFISNQDSELKQSRVTDPHSRVDTPAQAPLKPAINIKTAKKKSSKGSQLTKNIMAQAQSLKKDKNRTDSKTNYSAWLIVIGLVALLIWQTAIVNHTKLRNYNFLNAPLNLVCSVFSCNQQQPLTQAEFEILHANLRRHSAQPGVITISANLINYSNSDKLLPNIRLDLTDTNESIVASKTINLVDSPQFLDPAISQLAPGQDVKITFDVDRPPRSAVGFELNIVD